MSDRGNATLGAAVVNDDGRRRLQRRTLTVVAVSQVLGGAGLASGITVGALLAQQMLGSDAAAGLPSALFTLGSALSAYAVGRTTQRLGRRPGLVLGFGAGAVGALGVILAAVLWNPVLLFLFLFVYGGGMATNLQARYAGTDLATPEQRGRAVSIALVSTTFGAVAGPNLVEPMGSVAMSLGIPMLAGPFLLAAVAYLCAGAVLWFFLRPDPYRVAQSLEAQSLEAEPLEAQSLADAKPETEPSGPAVVVSPRPGRGVYLAAITLVLCQITMTSIMTMTPVHMKAHHHGLGDVGLVIAVHIGSMYFPSLVTGWLVDRIGRLRMAWCAGITLLLAAAVAATAPPDSLGFLLLALGLLGLGWNFGLITSTALVVDATAPGIRARTQGSVDVLVALSGAGGSTLSGVVMAVGDYTAVALGGGVLALCLIPVLLWFGRRGSIRHTAP